jgi:transcriptional regulator with XRE-family HTH domain
LIKSTGINTIDLMNNRSQFAQFMHRQFINWQYRSGEKKLQRDFANYLGVNEKTLSTWMNGKQKPTGDNAHKIAQLFGDEIYNYIDEDNPDPRLQAISRDWHLLSDDTKSKMLQIIEAEEKDIPEGEHGFTPQTNTT